MPVFRLGRDIVFPPTELADPDGLLAVGGDLSVPRLLCAYSQGIFPWYSKDSPLLWWFTQPRCVLRPETMHVPRSLDKILASNRFVFTVNADFARVMECCALKTRPGQKDTWILPEMIASYVRLHQTGWAHSVEAWYGDELAGGLYGVALGRVFFGESMFYERADASKAALVWLARNLYALGFNLIDCQQKTEHLLRFGAEMMPGREFSRLLEENISPSLDIDVRARDFFQASHR